MNNASRPLVIWRFSDQKPGHDTQSRGLCSALQQSTECRVEEFDATDRIGWLDLLSGRFAAGRDVHKPHLIIGAGHRTHVPMLCARRAYGGRVIVLMRPSLPTALFDLCLVPEHDGVRPGKKIYLTRGAINSIVPAPPGIIKRGLFLIGGPSRHFLWDEDNLINQIRQIVSSAGIRWRLSDSPRTPDSTRRLLAGLANEQVEFFSYRDTPQDWVARQLGEAIEVWVTSDSISMIYEALTSGAAVGLLEVPARQADRVVDSVANLAAQNMVTPFSVWSKRHELVASSVRLHEADRAAKFILDRFGLA